MHVRAYKLKYLIQLTIKQHYKRMISFVPKEQKFTNEESWCRCRRQCTSDIQCIFATSTQVFVIQRSPGLCPTPSLLAVHDLLEKQNNFTNTLNNSSSWIKRYQPLNLLFTQLCLFTYFDVSMTSAIFIRNYDPQMSVSWSKNRRYVTVGSPPHEQRWGGLPTVTYLRHRNVEVRK